MLTLVYRHFLVWSRHIFMSLALHLVAPVITLYGLSKVLGSLYPLTYIVPGFIANSAIISVFLSSTYGTLERFFSKRYESWLAANLSLAHVVLADALFQVCRGLIVGTGVWVAGLMMGLPFSLQAYFGFIPILALGVYTSSMMGLFIVALARSYDDIALCEPFMNAVFVFSGVFASTALFPPSLQWFAQLFPVYHVIEIIRPLFGSTALDSTGFITHLAALFSQALLFTFLAIKSFERRLLA